jgi:hypothetical protein
MNINDLLGIFSFLLRIASWVFAFIVIMRSKGRRRTILGLAFSYLVAGAIAFWILPSFTEAHYDYGDIIFMGDNRNEWPNMDINFLLIHLGFAVCLGWSLLKIRLMPNPSVRLFIYPLVALMAEILFRIGHWRILLFDNEYSAINEIIASAGPPIVAGFGIGICAFIIVARNDHRQNRCENTNS